MRPRATLDVYRSLLEVKFEVKFVGFADTTRTEVRATNRVVVQFFAHTFFFGTVLGIYLNATSRTPR